MTRAPTKLKTAYKPFRSWSPIHTGGEAALSGDAELLFTTFDEEVLVTRVRSGARLHTFEGDSSVVTSLACTPSSSQPSILIAYRSLAIRIYALEGSFDDSASTTVTLRKTIGRAHDAPISVSISDPTSSVFAAGDTAGVVRLWDVHNGHCTHVFKGHQLVSALTFDVSKVVARARIAVGAGDGRIKLWDLRESKLVGVFEHGHVSAVRGLAVSRDGTKLISGSRDKVLNVWDLSNAAGKVMKTIPVYETIESIGLVYPSDLPASKPKGKSKSQSENSTFHNHGLVVYTAGDKGLVRLWDLESGQQIATEEDMHAGDTSVPRSGIFDTRLDQASNTLLVTKIDLTLSLLSMPSLKRLRQIVGCHDEIIDAALLRSTANGPSTHLTLATNSPLIRVLSLGPDTNDTALLAGHTDVVLCLAKSPDQGWFVSGSKDRTARVWRTVNRGGKQDGQVEWECVGVCEGHMKSLGAVSVSSFTDTHHQRPLLLLATASQDRTVKLWDLAGVRGSEVVAGGDPPRLTSLLTLKVHEKDINAIDFSANGKLFATGSQDKLCKVFGVSITPNSGTSLTILGILKGHARGIWSVKFSNHEPVLATGSADCSIKLWSTTEGVNFGSCLKTFEGHLNAVLRVQFMNTGQQLVSSSSDALVKVWEIKTQVCVATLGDEAEEEEAAFGASTVTKQFGGVMMHDDKIWALEVEDEEGSKLLTAGADSKIIYWEDLTEFIESERVRAREEEGRLRQDVENYIRLKDYQAVVFLLLKLDKPVKLLRLFTDVGESDEDERGLNESITGSLGVDEVLRELGPAEVFKLLEYIRDWNAITRTAEVAQRVLYAIFKFHSYSDLLGSLTEADEEGMIGVLTDEENKKKQKKFKNKPKIKELMDGLLPYTERHLARLERSNQEVGVRRDGE
ncbi:hypothetical protein CROQUDRAFT_136891 [Cronartium quercuum f. sp. fusiforme G11]|uniref:U3 small nucleolar RNA-associated protein 13 C-terminal domain-containing protein n=1 Tax=Cronartium quercuum f. sp. fusiforme G11 TaxID=708437 RepID=A0A9P6T742_9BASI|nr:hypothetical protein CROQUDRAFT_136891 [Cronartium quercuum f. sp. fusiforme G11]